MRKTPFTSLVSSVRRDKRCVPESICAEINVVRAGIRLLLCLMIFGGPTLAKAECFKAVNDLKVNHVKRRWQETTENDGKPLLIAITDGDKSLIFSAKKAGELWLTGNVSACRRGGIVEIMLKNAQATKNVPLFARLGLPSVLSAQIVDNQIRLAGGSWRGTFVGQ